MGLKGKQTTTMSSFAARAANPLHRKHTPHNDSFHSPVLRGALSEDPVWDLYY